MFFKLRQNFRLADLLSRILFVLTYAFTCWQRAFAATYLVMQQANIWLAIVSALLLGVILQFLVPVAINLFLNLARIHNVPTAEYCVVAFVHFALGFVLCGVVNLFGWFFPVASVWISTLAPVVVTAAVGMLFFKVTSRLYFNDVTTPSYAKILAAVLFVFVAVVGVLA